MATQATRSQPGPGSAGRTSGRALGRSAAAAGAAPLTVIVGEEDLLVERAVTAVVRHGAAQAAGEPGSAPDVHDVRGAELTAGELGLLAAALPAEVTLVVTHAGGAKGKSLLAALLKAGARRIDCPSIRRFGERMDFLRGELARAGRKADDGGLRGLIDAVGTDLRDLAAACDQLASDTTGVINAQTVARYWRGRAEASGFSVADRALDGNLAEALAQLRWAL